MSTTHRTSPPATRWKPHRRYLQGGVPSGLCGWLLDPASLTQRLQRLCRTGFRVRVLSQCRGRPTRDEARVLDMPFAGLALIRQVHLLCGDLPWVYARTVIPVTALRGRLQRLAQLGSRPLGAMLFADAGMRRGVVELARITPGQPLYADALNHLQQHPAAIWGRRSVFRIADRPLLVSEIFLPDFPATPVGIPVWRRR